MDGWLVFIFLAKLVILLLLLILSLVHLLVHLLIIDTIFIHHLAVILLQRSQVAGRTSTLILLVLILQILDFILFFLDHDIDHLKVFHLLSLVGIGVHIVEKLSCFVLLAKLDLLLELVLFFFHLVDAFD